MNKIDIYKKIYLHPQPRNVPSPQRVASADTKLLKLKCNVNRTTNNFLTINNDKTDSMRSLCIMLKRFKKVEKLNLQVLAPNLRQYMHYGYNPHSSRNVLYLLNKSVSSKMRNESYLLAQARAKQDDTLKKHKLGMKERVMRDHEIAMRVRQKKLMKGTMRSCSDNMSTVII